LVSQVVQGIHRKPEEDGQQDSASKPLRDFGGGYAFVGTVG